MSAYSPWIWSEEYQRYYCFRRDEYGLIQYLWDSQKPQTQTEVRVTSTSSSGNSVLPAVNSSPTIPYIPLPPEPQLSLEHLPEDVQRSVGGDIPRRFIRTARDDNPMEGIHPGYRRVRPQHYPWFYKTGRVFKMLWTEPSGEDVPGGTRGSTHFSLEKFDQTYSEVRRFVVLENKGTFSQCIPIQTYRRQGATKRGLVIENHAVIYTGKEGDPPPSLLDGEAITKQAIRVEASKDGQLEKESRINFGKPYCVDHNCKIMDLGIVANEHIHLLFLYFKQAMEIL